MAFREFVPLEVALGTSSRNHSMILNGLGVIPLITITISGLGFVLEDDRYDSNAYAWGVFCVLSIVAESIWIKKNITKLISQRGN